jgi:hypothetical protein
MVLQEPSYPAPERTRRPNEPGARSWRRWKCTNEFEPRTSEPEDRKFRIASGTRSWLRSVSINPGGGATLSVTKRLWPAAFAGAVLAAAGGSPALADGRLAGGLYRVEVVIEMPNVLRPMPFDVVERCVAEGEADGAFLRIVSNPKIAECPLVRRSLDRDRLTLEVVCAKLNTGRASARYELGEASYTGRIEVTMGGKNMTMTEIQRAVRLGDCL